MRFGTGVVDREGTGTWFRAHRSAACSIALNGAATLQAVWFYLAYVRSYLDLQAFESGAAHAPFQYRLLLMGPLRWAHASPLCAHIATALTAMHPWFPHGVRPEALVQFPVDVAAVVVAGLVARRLYLAASPTGVLAVAVYPLTLLMVLTTYALGTMFRLRFVYDLPSLGFFAAGMFLLYFRRPRWQFALLFLVATLNRETTFFLLGLLLLQAWSKAPRTGRPWWRRATLPVRDAVFAGALLAAWVAWHLWVAHHFAANPTESWNRFSLNLKLLLVPTSWLQVMSCFAFCGPLVVLWRRSVPDPVLRQWLWIVPAWVLFMLRYGLLLESRVFGELIPLVACVTALGAEAAICRKLAASPLSRTWPERGAVQVHAV